MDSALKKKGIAFDAVVEPDPLIFNQYTDMLKGQHTGLVRSTLELKYGEEIAHLRQQSQQAQLYNSVFGGKVTERDVYQDTINIMLDKRPDDRDSVWNKFNAITSEKFAQWAGQLNGAVRHAQATGDWKLMNEKLEQFGIPAIYSEANQLMLTNLKAPKQVLEPLVSKANAFVALSMLRLDTMQAIVNAISLPIMAVPEFSALVRVASKDRWQALRDGTSVKMEGIQEAVPTAGPMMFQAFKNFFGPKRDELIKRYKEQGLINSTMEEVAMLNDDFAKLAKLSDPKEVESGLNKLLKLATTPVDFSEQMVKFVAANMADQVLDTLKIPSYLREATINTFVNRVHGNYLASQRPSMFQGWMGQAVGLFQTYQFNLIQSFLKNVQAGNKAAVAKMVGLQAGLFGAQSVPGFQMVNQYIGEKSSEGNDFYSTTTGALGDTVGNALLYGLASSSTVPITGQGLDLYSRGDLTPRTPLLIPTSISEVPAISVTGNFISSVTGAMSKLFDGAPPMETMLTALGHNGLNRPLQGIAQLMSGERTTNDGRLLFTYEGWDTWNSITKMLGTRTLDEAVAASSFYRTASYKAARQERLDGLGESYREVVRAGAVDQATYFDFMKKYTERGGNYESFNRWVINNHKNATQSQINQLRYNNNSPEGRYMQQVMGADVEDWSGEF
jgi:hypothetical protein